MTASDVTVAAFDFDGTLTHRDTVVPFLRRFTTTGRLAASLLPQTFRFLPIAARRDRDRLRALATDLVFRGRPLDDVMAHATAWGSQIAGNGLRADTTARLQWHAEHGHRIVIVSASYEPYVRVVADALGEIAVLATRLEADDGRCTGRHEGANCRGPEKVHRLRAWLDDEGLARDEITLYAYGDSEGDRELLAWADHPYWVDEPLASVAP